MKIQSVFDLFSEEYDLWYEKNYSVYLSELRAIEPHLPPSGPSLEIGVGTGRFADPLRVDFGIDPSHAMLLKAKMRGLKVIRGCAENLPFRDSFFEWVLLVVTICFLPSPVEALKEIRRVLRRGGRLIVGFVDKESFLGKLYLEKKEKNKFYRSATFYSSEEVIKLLREQGFEIVQITQTIFRDLPEIDSVEPVKIGFGEGGFVVLSASKV